MTKPFSPRELVARVKAILRRGRNTTVHEQQILTFKHLKIDIQRHEVERDGESIELTALEFKLLAMLATYAQMVLTRQQLLERVWGYDFYGEERVVDVHIGHVRQKLELDPSDPQLIVTVRGVGYKFADEPL
jgi:DNA-binding response OmpR family regulator